MTGLQDLPTELLLQIFNQLAPSARLSLRLSTKTFFRRLPEVPSSSFTHCSRCERNAFKRIFHERAFQKKEQRRCVLCGSIQSTDFFRGSVPICKWHDAWFLYSLLLPDTRANARIVTSSQNPGTAVAQWVPLDRSYCVHDRQIIGWDVPRCFCDCDSCGHFEVMCYFRASLGN